MIVLMVCVRSALKRPLEETCERTLITMAEAAREFLIIEAEGEGEREEGGGSAEMENSTNKSSNKEIV